MLDLTIDEADRCPHCGAVLREQPDCWESTTEYIAGFYRYGTTILEDDYAEFGGEAGGA